MKVAGCGYDHVPGTCDPTEHAMATRLAAANSCMSPCLGALSNREGSRRGAPRAKMDCRFVKNNLRKIKNPNKKQVYPTNEDQPVLHLMHVSPTNEDHMLVYGVGICFSLRRGHMFNFNAFVKNEVAFTSRLAVVVNRYALSLAAEAVDGKPNAPTVFLISHTRCVITNVVAGSEGRGILFSIVRLWAVFPMT